MINVIDQDFTLNKVSLHCGITTFMKYKMWVLISPLVWLLYAIWYLKKEICVNGFGTRADCCGSSAVNLHLSQLWYKSQRKQRDSVCFVWSIFFVIHLLGCDSATLVTLCVYVVAYLVLFLTDGIQRARGSWRTLWMCKRTGCISYKS